MEGIRTHIQRHLHIMLALQLCESFMHSKGACRITIQFLSFHTMSRDFHTKDMFTCISQPSVIFYSYTTEPFTTIVDYNDRTINPTHTYKEDIFNCLNNLKH